ncbi:MAG TPA: AraC family transcriptional regulator [Amaricoccus sp.]|uniref:AraC family transcriptional regulator n=1 Tax=Amaricoccus sp. TaxID=1872485 RepID=UPI002C1A8A8A|nr:AraC family transcriptional regulator [Amaricoccus sp.]HMR37045.1 AraC family transcriptional regulator [Paracoccus sp. (in: a-proteobacteria)]HMR54171.1 AraC family transcriptional regulator [Amaricoccus sp.]HMU01200.1 AraC family transcriptional regulator [Amaricoccus sp.]
MPITGIEVLRDAVLGAGLDAVQMSRGRVAGSLVFAEVDGVLYGSGSINGRVSLVGPLSEERVTLGIGLAFPEGARHWQQEVAAGGVGIFLPGDEHDALYRPGARYVAATLSLERLEAEAARQDLVLDRRALGGSRIHPRPLAAEVLRRLDRRLRAVHVGASGDAALGPDLLAAMVAHCAREPQRQRTTARQPRHRRIVIQARAYVAAHLDEPISVDAVAAAAGTSRRTLYRAFVELVEETPSLYVRRLRLHRIRHDLASPEEAATAIALLAAKWGVGEPGRLSGWYRELFGELPSETRAAYRRIVKANARPASTLARSA